MGFQDLSLVPELREWGVCGGDPFSDPQVTSTVSHRRHRQHRGEAPAPGIPLVKVKGAHARRSQPFPPTAPQMLVMALGRFWRGRAGGRAAAISWERRLPPHFPIPDLFTPV